MRSLQDAFRVYLCCQLFCIKCNKAFLAVEKGPQDFQHNVKVNATPTVKRPAKKQKYLDDYGGCTFGGNPMEQAVTGNKRPFSGFIPLSKTESRALLVEKARKDISAKLKEWNLADATPRPSPPLQPANESPSTLSPHPLFSFSAPNPNPPATQPLSLLLQRCLPASLFSHPPLQPTTTSSSSSHRHHPLQPMP